MPRSRHARKIRTAISPRFATRSLIPGKRETGNGKREASSNPSRTLGVHSRRLQVRPSDKATRHCKDTVQRLLTRTKALGAQIAGLASNVEQELQLRSGTPGCEQKPTEFLLRPASGSFGDVRRNRNSCSSDLRNEPELLVRGKPDRVSIKVNGKLARYDVKVETLVKRTSLPQGRCLPCRFPFSVSRFPAQSGIFPCFLAGRLALFPSRSLNAAMSFSRVSEGSMISSM